MWQLVGRDQAETRIASVYSANGPCPADLNEHTSLVGEGYSTRRRRAAVGRIGSIIRSGRTGPGAEM